MDGLFILLAVFIGLVFLLSKLANSPQVKGQIGEAAVDRKLSQSLDKSHYKVLDDVTLETSRGTTQIDHIVLSPFGIFVIETKNMSGWIFGSERDPYWTQSFRRSKNRFQNPLRQNYAHVKALQEVLGLNHSKFFSLVVFTGNAEFKTAKPDNVISLDRLIPFIQRKMKVLISMDDLDSLLDIIKHKRLEPGNETLATHIASLSATHESASRTVADARGLIKEGTKALFVLKVVAVLVLILGALLAAGLILNGYKSLTNLGGKVTAPPIVKQQHLLIRDEQRQTAVKQQSHSNDYNKWLDSLYCGYSPDTQRCACYDPEGNKARLAFEDCKALALKGRH